MRDRVAGYPGVLLFLALVLISCSGPSEDFRRLSWLEGTWHGTTDSGTAFYERWVRHGNATMLGAGFEVAGADTTFGEKLRIEDRQDGIYYVADVPQNPEAVAFRMVAISDDRVVFENPEHDFPQRFVYERRGEDGLYVRAESIDGVSRVEFNLERND